MREDQSLLDAPERIAQLLDTIDVLNREKRGLQQDIRDLKEAMGLDSWTPIRTAFSEARVMCEMRKRVLSDREWVKPVGG